MRPPTYTESDTLYHGIFVPWDGIWEGSFKIYTDPNGQKAWNRTKLTMADSQQVKKYQLTSVVQVRQKYESVTPYFQLVEITDRYVEGQDTIQSTSRGVNKVEDGLIWCIVDKPEDLVVHQGHYTNPGTLTWSREEKEPLRKEHFLETIMNDSYKIVGFGYYGSDNPDLSPRTWFLASYHHISDYIR